jgi:hypothetical protein
MQRIRVLGLLLAATTCASAARATQADRPTPTIRFMQYGLQSDTGEAQTKSNVTVATRVLRITDIYDHPELFAFSLDAYPEFASNPFLTGYYPADASGRRWEYWFASPDASEQLLVYWVHIRNGTDHILRMGDARIYLIPQAHDPIPALAGVDAVLAQVDRFWNMQIQNWNTQLQAAQRRGRVSPSFVLPTGFVRAVLQPRRAAFRVINDVGREILPGFAFDGMLAFPVVPATFGSVTLSFFDITTRTDAAGTPVERARFDFTLRPDTVQMWYDASVLRWKTGVPPPPHP